MAAGTSAELRQALEARATDLVLVVTGAGISRASGIATYRGTEPDAVWKISDVEMATRDTLCRDPVGQWSWYLERFRKLELHLISFDQFVGLAVQVAESHFVLNSGFSQP